MPVEVRHTNLRQFAVLAKAMGQASKDLKKELRKGLVKAVKPLGQKVKTGIPKYMPSGYAPVLRRAFRATTRIRLSGNPSVTVIGRAKGRSKQREVQAMDRGVLRHPVFGNRRVWRAQRIRPGFWSDPMREGAPAVREEAAQVIADVNAKIVQEVRRG